MIVQKNLLPLRCRLRQAQRGRDLLGAEASGRNVFHGETLHYRSHYVVVKMPENTWDLEDMWLEVCGYVIKSVMCVGVQCGKICCFTIIFTTGVFFHPKRFEI